MSFRPDSMLIHLPVGTVAALLTTCEYLFTTVAAMLARAAVHGFWLLNLHRGGEAPIDVRSHVKRAFQKDVLGFTLGVWLVISVALVESNLKPSVTIRKPIFNSPLCLNFSHAFEPRLLDILRPPMNAVVEPWVLHVAESLACKDSGIASVGVGGATNIFGQKLNMCAPICDPAMPVTDRPVGVQLTNVKAENFGFELRPGLSAVYELLPLSTEGIGLCLDMTRRCAISAEKVEMSGVCAQRGISSFDSSLSSAWMTKRAHQQNITAALQNRVCAAHGVNESVEPIDDDIVRACMDIEEELVNASCVRKVVRTKGSVHEVYLKNMAALFIGKDKDDASYACMNSTIRFEYVFISTKIVLSLEGDAFLRFPVILPTRVEAVSGHCERTIHVLARAALLFSVDAHWQESELARLDPVTRYYAYMMAVSSSQFPLALAMDMHTGKLEIMPDENSTCVLRDVQGVTEVEKDWRLVLLVLAVVISVFVMSIGVVFRLVYCGEAWSVGSAYWSLSRLMGQAGEGRSKNGVFIQVVPVSRNDEQNRKNKTSPPAVPTARMTSSGRSSSTAGSKLGNGGTSLFHRQFRPGRSFTPSSRRASAAFRSLVSPVENHVQYRMCNVYGEGVEGGLDDEEAGMNGGMVAGNGDAILIVDGVEGDSVGGNVSVARRRSGHGGNLQQTNSS